MPASYEAILEQWQEFMETSRIPEGVHPVIADSWARCKEAGVDPARGFGVAVPQDELDSRLQSKKMLISVAKPMMDSLYQIIKSTVYSIVLSDQDGVILHVLCNEDIEPHSRKINFSVGAKWDERSVGTNALGTALAAGQAIQVLGAEHYCQAHHGWTCSAAPIRDGSGAVIGCLDLSGKAEEVHIHTFGIIVSAVKSIEEQLGIMEAHQLMDTVFDSMLDGLMIIDTDYRIKKANSRLAAIFLLDPEELYALDIRELLRETEIEEAVFRGRSGLNYADCTLNVKNRRIDCMLRMFPYEFNNRILGAALLIREAGQVRKEVNQLAGFIASHHFETIITRNDAMQNTIAFARRISKTGCTVLIEGESGTGKELFAQSIHNGSNRAGGPFIAINCAALPRDLVESELFGYEKGSFTGALREGSPGKFELADGGTIFLDEIGELPLEIQAKLLRVLDNHKVRRIGGKHERLLDVRVIAATNRDLQEEVARKSFRSDLYYRLNVISLRLLPLRERREDIPALAEWFLKQCNRDSYGEPKTFSPSFLGALLAQEWKGNAREVQNAVQRAYYLCETDCIDHTYLPDARPEIARTVAGSVSVSGENAMTGAGKSWQQIERASIEQALRETGGSAVDAARRLGISKSGIYRKIKTYGIRTQ